MLFKQVIRSGTPSRTLQLAVLKILPRTKLCSIQHFIEISILRLIVRLKQNLEAKIVGNLVHLFIYFNFYPGIYACAERTKILHVYMTKVDAYRDVP